MLINGDCLEILQGYDSNTFDLIVTDPPYGIAFMGKDWDKALPNPEVWTECFRVLKEGKMAFIMCSPRQDVLSRMIISLETAGFRTNYTSIYWTYASGFPKAKNNKDGSYVGFQPKPAVEVILVVTKGKSLTWLDDCRIPYSSDAEFEKVKKGNEIKDNSTSFRESCQRYGYDRIVNPSPFKRNTIEKGRFPANLLVSDDVLNDGKITKSVRSFRGTMADIKGNNYGRAPRQIEGVVGGYDDSGSYSRYFDLDAWVKNNMNCEFCNHDLDIHINEGDGLRCHSIKTKDHYQCECKPSKTHPFIITPKASKSERNKGCEDLPLKDIGHTMSDRCSLCNRPMIGVKGHEICKCENPKREHYQNNNHHPTVKPLKLMSYLITMGSRENDLVLDPFVGSGTTYIAATQLNRKCVGIELNPEYLEIAKARLVPYLQQTKLL